MTLIDIYTTQFCPFCIRAKELLQYKNVEFNEISVDGNPALREEMTQRANGGYNVPQIFIDDLHIGGCDQLMRLYQTNQLDQLLFPDSAE